MYSLHKIFNFKNKVDKIKIPLLYKFKSTIHHIFQFIQNLEKRFAIICKVCYTALAQLGIATKRKYKYS